MELFVIDIDHDSRTIIAIPKWTFAKRQYGNIGLAAKDRSWKGRNIVFLTTQPFAMSEKLGHRASKHSDDPNDISNLMNVRQRQHAANDDEGAVNPESDD
jgi:hypothetical protein